jgi:hypothetical protein
MQRHDTTPDGAKLSGAITNLGAEFIRLRSQLDEARSEIVRLRRKLATRQAPELVSGVEIGSLRRQVAYYCHPDRGGDHGLMSSLNTLFDMLESCQQPG